MLDDQGRVLADLQDNHHAQNTIRLSTPVTTGMLKIETLSTGTAVPPAVWRCHQNIPIEPTGRFRALPYKTCFQAPADSRKSRFFR